MSEINTNPNVGLPPTANSLDIYTNNEVKVNGSLSNKNLEKWFQQAKNFSLGNMQLEAQPREVQEALKKNFEQDLEVLKQYTEATCNNIGQQIHSITNPKGLQKFINACQTFFSGICNRIKSPSQRLEKLQNELDTKLGEISKLQNTWSELYARLDELTREPSTPATTSTTGHKQTTKAQDTQYQETAQGMGQEIVKDLKNFHNEVDKTNRSKQSETAQSPKNSATVSQSDKNPINHKGTTSTVAPNTVSAPSTQTVPSVPTITSQQNIPSNRTADDAAVPPPPPPPPPPASVPRMETASLEQQAASAPQSTTVAPNLAEIKNFDHSKLRKVDNTARSTNKPVSELEATLAGIRSAVVDQEDEVDADELKEMNNLLEQNGLSQISKGEYSYYDDKFEKYKDKLESQGYTRDEINQETLENYILQKEKSKQAKKSSNSPQAEQADTSNKQADTASSQLTYGPDTPPPPPPFKVQAESDIIKRMGKTNGHRPTLGTDGIQEMSSKLKKVGLNSQEIKDIIKQTNQKVSDSESNLKKHLTDVLEAVVKNIKDIDDDEIENIEEIKRFDLSLINKEDVDSVRNSVQTLLDTYGKAIQDLQKASNLKEDETAALKEYEKSYASLEKIQGNPEKGKEFSIGQLQQYLDVTIDADEW